MSAPSGDAAQVSVFVAVSPVDAFEVFTEEIDLWWGQGPRFRIGTHRPGRLTIVGGPNGRLFESFETKSGVARTFEVGRVLTWEPPSKLVLEWRNVNFKPHEKTLVEVGFAPMGDGTLVTVRHSGWSSLPDGHPAKHGKSGPELSRMIGLFWGELMSSLRERVATTRSRPQG
ncbi:MAG: SRPBCC domain-containing protein [Polyangiaceae bacterium]